MAPISKERQAELDAMLRRESSGEGAGSSALAAVDAGEDRLDPRRDVHDTVFALFGGAVRSGNWEPPEKLSVTAMFGGVELDFSDADLLEGTTRVEVFAFCGGVDIIVPDDVDVDTRGIGIFGGFKNHSQRAPEDGAPRLEIHGFALFGGCDIKPAK